MHMYIYIFLKKKHKASTYAGWSLLYGLVALLGRDIGIPLSKKIRNMKRAQHTINFRAEQ